MLYDNDDSDYHAIHIYNYNDNSDYHAIGFDEEQTLVTCDFSFKKLFEYYF